jgi:hypothetical protein
VRVTAQGDGYVVFTTLYKSKVIDLHGNYVDIPAETVVMADLDKSEDGIPTSAGFYPIGWCFEGVVVPAADVTVLNDTTISFKLIDISGVCNGPTFLRAMENAYYNRNTTQIRNALYLLYKNEKNFYPRTSRTPYDSRVYEKSFPKKTNYIAANWTSDEVQSGIVLWFSNEQKQASGHILITDGEHAGKIVQVFHTSLMTRQGYTIKELLPTCTEYSVQKGVTPKDRFNFFGYVLYPGEYVSFTLKAYPRAPDTIRPNMFIGFADNVTAYRGEQLLAERMLYDAASYQLTNDSLHFHFCTMRPIDTLTHEFHRKLRNDLTSESVTFDVNVHPDSDYVCDTAISAALSADFIASDEADTSSAQQPTEDDAPTDEEIDLSKILRVPIGETGSRKQQGKNKGKKKGKKPSSE